MSWKIYHYFSGLVLSEEAQKQNKQEVEESLAHTLSQINSGLESHQVLDHVVIMQSEWTIENDLLTPTLKVKRHVLEERFHDVIQASYNAPVVRVAW